MYIYIYRERERNIGHPFYTHIYIYIYIFSIWINYIYNLSPMGKSCAHRWKPIAIFEQVIFESLPHRSPRCINWNPESLLSCKPQGIYDLFKQTHVKLFSTCSQCPEIPKDLKSPIKIKCLDFKQC